MCYAVQTGNVTLTATSPNLKAVQLNTATILTAAIGYQLVSATTSVAPAWTSSGTPTESAYNTESYKQAVVQTLSHCLMEASILRLLMEARHRVMTRLL
jgi:hypothetical protein